ncbi:hypothetical protein BOSE21B_110675 [Bosea sp. 21B]|nr:hypothetical protein BOSE21B_110675 [Bosea sp. 21B]
MPPAFFSSLRCSRCSLRKLSTAWFAECATAFPLLRRRASLHVHSTQEPKRKFLSQRLRRACEYDAEYVEQEGYSPSSSK